MRPLSAPPGRLLTALVCSLALAAAGAHSVAATSSPRPATVPLTRGGTVHDVTEHRVDLPLAATHVAFSWRGDARDVRYRVAAGPWRRAPADHALASGPRRFSGVVSVGRIASLEWRGPRRTSVRDLEVHYMNTLDGPRREVRGVSESARADGLPRVVTRAEWGADESIKRSRGGCRRRFFPLRQIFVHHTAGSNRDPHPEATMRAIYYFHTVTRGWCDVGYNFVIGPGGRIFEGRWARRFDPGETHDSEDPSGRVARGAHVAEFNSGSVGIGLMGNFSTTDVPRAMRRALVSAVAWEAARHGLDPRARRVYINPETGLRKRLPVVAGHRDAGQTSCPGGNLYARLGRIRRAAARAVAERPRTRARLSIEPGKVAVGAVATVSGELRTRRGAPVPGRTLRLYRKGGRGWRVLDEVTTSPGGRFSTSFAPRRSLRIAADFEGGDAMWGSSSGAVRLRVRPRVSLATVGGRVDADGVAHFPAGTRRVTLQGSIAPSKPRVTVRVSRLHDNGGLSMVRRARVGVGSDGSYRARVVLPAAARRSRFRARTWFRGDRRHAVARSRIVAFVVGGG
ncbi:MAG TPA: N-acetylmuramoyl-L-alanine amidase [Actinomycetota bacterium]|nr:N-acetylmuramoyl-L-alanine amidase [Actinomycetota bacterium]